MASISASCSLASAMAVATISSPMSPIFIGTRMRWNSAPRGSSVDGSHVLEQAAMPRSADRAEDNEAEHEPCRADVARTLVRHHGEHPDRRGEWRPDESRDRNRSSARGTLGRARNGRASAGSRIRSRITASWAAVNAMRTPNE